MFSKPLRLAIITIVKSNVGGSATKFMNFERGGVPKQPNEVTGGEAVCLDAPVSDWDYVAAPQLGYLGNRCSIHLSYGAICVMGPVRGNIIISRSDWRSTGAKG